MIAVDGPLLRHTGRDNIGRLPMLLLHNSKGDLASSPETKETYNKLTEQSEYIEMKSYSNTSGRLEVSELS